MPPSTAQSPSATTHFGSGVASIGALQRLAHILGHRSGHQQHVGVTRRGDKAQAKALEIVKGVVERVNFKLAAVAGAGIDLADGETAAERRRAARSRLAASSASAASSAAGGFGERAAREPFEQHSAHLEKTPSCARSRARGNPTARSPPSRGRAEDASYLGKRIIFQRSCPEYEQLNDLLQSGKSATMLPSMAASSSGH